MSKKILVIGGSGQIGQDLKSSRIKTSKKFIFPDSKEIDITKKKSISSFLDNNNVDLVLNFAAYTNVDQAEVDRKKAFNINCKGALNLAIETNKRGIYLLHFSTDYVFGKDNIGINYYNKINSPANYYGLTKSEGEKAILLNSNYSLIIRLASVYGVNGKNFIKTITKLLLTTHEVSVVRDQKISLTGSYELAKNIDYLIDLSIKKIKNDNFSPKIMHFTNKGYTNWYKVAKIINSEIQLILNKKIKSKLKSIESSDWNSLAKRPLDSRLKVNFKEFEKEKISLPKWQDSVRIFVRKILPEILKDIKNDK